MSEIQYNLEVLPNYTKEKKKMLIHNTKGFHTSATVYKSISRYRDINVPFSWNESRLWNMIMVFPIFV